MSKALILVDIQRDFLPGGALGVDEGDQVVPVANRLAADFEIIAATRDWHPPDHGSFAANHPGKVAGQTVILGGREQILWPTHCVQESGGAQFAPGLDAPISAQFLKGTDPEVDSYSGFFDNDRQRSTSLHDYLRRRGVNAVSILGLATDYCVKFTALDAVSLGYETHLILDGCRAVNLQPGDGERAVEEMRAAGVLVHSSEDHARPA